MEKEIEAFWEKFEKDCGEKVRLRAMAQMFSSASDRGDWGLLVLTDKSLRFRKTPGENWFASLFKGTAPQAPENPAQDLVIPLQSIAAVRSPPRKALDFLFGSPFAGIVVEFSAVPGPEAPGLSSRGPTSQGQRSIRFAVDPREGFKEALLVAL